MNKIHSSLLAATLLASPVVFASDPFAGFSAELRAVNTSYEASISNFATDGTPVPTSVFRAEDIDKSKTIGGFALGYTFPINQEIYLGISYQRSLQDAKLGSPAFIEGGVRVIDDETRIKVKHDHAFVISPGFKISDTALLSLRIGYAQSQTDLVAIGDPTISIKASGILLGLGLRYAITPSVYVSGAYDVYNYGSKSVTIVEDDGERISFNYKPKGSAFSISIGYRF